MSFSHERLLSILRYDPETGIFVWRVRLGNRASGVGKEAGWVGGNGYRYLSIDGHPYLTHRVAWFYMTGEWPNGGLDHRNRNSLDNRWSNLREATQSMNVANTKIRSTNTSGFKGVHLRKRSNRWLAEIWKDGKKTFLGSYASAEEASAAYQKAAIERFGEFVRFE